MPITVTTPIEGFQYDINTPADLLVYGSESPILADIMSSGIKAFNIQSEHRTLINFGDWDFVNTTGWYLSLLSLSIVISLVTDPFCLLHSWGFTSFNLH